MKVKVIINDGVTVGVLSDCDVEIEIIDDDRDYEDHEYLEKYGAEVRSDPTLREVDYTVAHFGEDGKPNPWTHKD